LTYFWYQCDLIQVAANIQIPKNRGGSSIQLAGWTFIIHLWAIAMESAAQIPCEVCGHLAAVLQNEHIDPLGKRLVWPKAAVKSDGIYFTIKCPTCGERSQRIAQRPKESPKSAV
jgi:hypothetical protein